MKKTFYLQKIQIVNTNLRVIFSHETHISVNIHSSSATFNLFYRTLNYLLHQYCAYFINVLLDGKLEKH